MGRNENQDRVSSRRGPGSGSQTTMRIKIKIVLRAGMARAVAVKTTMRIKIEVV
jgi:hypothetical protein